MSAAKKFDDDEILATGFPNAIAIQTAALAVRDESDYADRGLVAIDKSGNLRYWYSIKPQIGVWFKGSIVYITD